MITAPELNTYGPYARASLLADYVELLALKGQPVQRAMLADFLADAGWNFDLIQTLESNGGDAESNALSDRLDEADEVASVVFRQLDERRSVLAQRYPFEISDYEVVLDSRVDLEASEYAVVLALTIAHAFDVSSVHQLDKMFERIVLKVLRARGLSSSGVAAYRRDGRSFENALRAACDEVGLKADPSAAVRHKYAHDEGVDILCHLGWEADLRPGTWGFIGQVTVGRSDSWERKAKDPDPDQWKLFAGTWVRPAPFLAVPHHVERPMMQLLAQNAGAVVLDRLRLVQIKDEIESDEREILRAVIQEDVEPLTG